MKPREPFTFFVDRCLGKHDVPNGIRSELLANENVECLDDHYAQNAEDAVWISEIGAKGWIVITKDAALRRNPLEIRAMLAAKTAFFIFGNASATGAQMAAGLKTALPRIRKAARRFEVSVIARLTIAGDVEVLWADGKKLGRPKRLK